MIPLRDDNPIDTVPFVNYGIIAVNIAVFLYMLTLGEGSAERFIRSYAMAPGAVLGDYLRPSALPAPLTAVTSMFLHGGLLHVAGNMLFLWVFGDNIEDALGHLRYVVFYLACGVAAAMSHALLNPGSTVPMLGASGAVSGVLGAYMVLYPRARVWTFFFLLIWWQVLPVPAVYVIGLWIAIQVLNGLTSGQSGGGIAWFAHVGGFAAGLLLIFLFGGTRLRRARGYYN